jgi:hypothetical protein
MPPPDTSIRRRVGYIPVEEEDTDVHRIEDEIDEAPAPESVQSQGWHALTSSFAASGALTLFAYFFPAIFSIPLFGTYLARQWLWTFTPSLAYVGQGSLFFDSCSILGITRYRDHHGSDFGLFTSFFGVFILF